MNNGIAGSVFNTGYSGIGSGIGGGIGSGIGGGIQNNDVNDSSAGQLQENSEEGDYEPTLEGKLFLYFRFIEIHQYAAIILGMDIEKDKEFLFIA
jgi:hypothetical protein